MSSTITSVLESAGRVAFELAYVYSPIFLTGGIAAEFGFEGILPLAAIASVANAATNLLAGNFNPENLGVQFMPSPGATLQEVDIGLYPFANQSVAANASISNPLHVSMVMLAPANNAGGYTAKLATMTAMKYTLDQHRQLGGTFTVLTPSYAYFNCILTKLSDVSTDQSKQSQYMWQFDFVQPLVTLSQATQVYNTQMQSLSQGLPNTGATSGSNVAGGSAISNSGTVPVAGNVP